MTKDDLISRQAAIDALGGNEPVGDPSKMDDDDVVKMWERIRIINIINKLPSAQPNTIPVDWIQKYADDWEDIGYAYENPILGMLEDWREEQDGKNT